MKPGAFQLWVRWSQRAPPRRGVPHLDGLVLGVACAGYTTGEQFRRGGKMKRRRRRRRRGRREEETGRKEGKSANNIHILTMAPDTMFPLGSTHTAVTSSECPPRRGV